MRPPTLDTALDLSFELILQLRALNLTGKYTDGASLASPALYCQHFHVYLCVGLLRNSILILNVGAVFRMNVANKSLTPQQRHLKCSMVFFLHR